MSSLRKQRRTAHRLQRMFFTNGPQRCVPFRAFPSSSAPTPSLVSVPFSPLELCPCVAHRAVGVQRPRSARRPQGVERLKSPLPTRSVSPQSARPDALLSFSVLLWDRRSTILKRGCSGADVLKENNLRGACRLCGGLLPAHFRVEERGLRRQRTVPLPWNPRSQSQSRRPETVPMES